MKKRSRSQNELSTTDVVERIFEHWRVRLGHPRSRLDQQRRAKITQRLADGYTEQDLLDAIEGCALSPFHQGENDRGMRYDDIELICRDAKHVDQFLRIKERADRERARAAALAEQRRREEEEFERRANERLFARQQTGDRKWPPSLN